MEVQKLDIAKVPKVRLVAAAGTLAVLAAVSYIAWLALLGALSIAAVGVISLVGIAVVQALPLLGQRWENKLLALRKAEARQNPIEQLQNDYMRREALLNQEESDLTDAGESIRGMYGMLTKQQKEDPEIDLSQEHADYENMVRDFDERKQLFAEAKAALAEYKKYIERRAFKFKYAVAADKTKSTLKANSKEAATNNLLAEEADNAIQDRYNRVFAQMEVARASRGQHALSHDPSQVIDIAPVTNKQVQLVERKA